MVKKQKFIIYSPLYDENIGGIIVLHKLGQILNSKGFDVYLWPFSKLNLNGSTNSNYFRKILGDAKDRFLYKKYRSPYNLNIAFHSDLKDAVVIYPEVVSGNPLNAEKVVRWFLHKPGYHTGIINYGVNELYFYYNKAFYDSRINLFSENHLELGGVMSDLYKQINFGNRSGVCYMIRKGKDRDLSYHPENATLLDNLSHEEIANAFNEYEYFISYDLYTMYSKYAAMCGCKSIVVPMENVSKENWYPDENSRLGIAYGLEDCEWAESSRIRIFELNKEIQKRDEKAVDSFVLKCNSFFNLN